MKTLTIIDRIDALKYPADVKELGKLSILELQIWISRQDPRQVIYWAQTKEYRQFIYWNYLLPVKIKRLMYRLKRLFSA